MTTVVLLQNLVPPYRWPFINGLSAVGEFDVTVLHSDPSLPQHALDCNQRHVSPKRFMGLTDQPGSGRLTRSSDVVIAMFDLRWIAMWREALTRPRALVLWGHGYGRSRLGGKIRTALAHRAAHLITYEESGAEAFRAMGVESERITVAGNTVDVPNHGIVDERRDAFLFVGRLLMGAAIGDEPEITPLDLLFLGSMERGRFSPYASLNRFALLRVVLSDSDRPKKSANCVIH